MNSPVDKIKNKQSFIQHVQAKQESYTGVYRKLASYLINNFVEVAFMRAQQWAAEVETSEVSVIRFVRVLGFKGYPDFSEKLQQIIRNQMTTTEYAELSVKKGRKGMDILMDIIKSEERNFNELVSKYSPKVMAEIVELLGRTERVAVVGLRSSSSLAEYSSYMFTRALAKEVITINQGGVETFDSFLPWEGKEAVAVVFGYPRYPVRTLEIAEYLKRFNWPVVAVTNNELSPLVPLADYVLYAPAHSVAFTDSMGAASVIINTIIMEYINKYQDSSLERLKRFEELAREKQYYWT
ncbi:MAG TPA: MurR/RpiR family transcriptional regulator [Selenomonadales bacterium]|nr:MurR/RpiR family transcriptional regulator [Selenomonadales bacterium]